MTIILPYVTETGKQSQVELEKDIKKISLNDPYVDSFRGNQSSFVYDYPDFPEKIASIDLKTLELCADLQTLQLEGNSLQSIDLTPLSSCTNIQEICLDNNQLQTIDLSPLGSCKKLQYLYLAENQIHSIDLAPLSTCNNLLNLRLTSNQLQSVDLAPLSTCGNLQILGLSGNQIKTIDLTPLSSCSKMQRLNLHLNQLTSIGLSPLAACSKLEKLNLTQNQLQIIDLSPLEAHRSLQQLFLNGNKLQTIDLSSLNTCTNLEYLTLDANELKSIDLSPLTSCSKLIAITLIGNNIESIDLSPVASCSNLGHVDLQSNKLQSVDLTPLIFRLNESRVSIILDDNCISHSWLYLEEKEKTTVYKSPTGTYPWPFLLRVWASFRRDFRVQQDILFALGLGNYGFIDCNLWEAIDPLISSPETSFATVRYPLIEAIVEEISIAADMGAATTGLRIDEVASIHPEIARKSHEIIKTRNKEMQRVQVRVKDEWDDPEEMYDLSDLWLTAYGYEVLSALDMRLTTDLEGLKQIESALAELGFNLKTGKTSVLGAKMSDEMKWVIWWIVGNRNRLWDEIYGRTDGIRIPYDPLKREQRKLVRGHTYRLADVFDSIQDARSKVKELEKNNYVFLSNIDSKRWAVHYRPKNQEE